MHGAGVWLCPSTPARARWDATSGTPGRSLSHEPGLLDAGAHGSSVPALRRAVPKPGSEVPKKHCRVILASLKKRERTHFARKKPSLPHLHTAITFRVFAVISKRVVLGRLRVRRLQIYRLPAASGVCHAGVSLLAVR